MVNNATHRDVSPPRIATAMLAAVALRRDKDALIGDLAEEFASRAQTSVKKARRWYWRQTALSLPQLLLARMRAESFRRVVLTLLAAIGAFLLVRVWDVYIARGAARAFYQLTGGESFAPARIMYFSVQALGFAVAGALIAITTFARNQPLLKNLLYRLGPAALLLFAPFVYYAAAASDDYPVAIRLLQLALAAPALFIGAIIAVRFGSD